jgi:hypothetical protein
VCNICVPEESSICRLTVVEEPGSVKTTDKGEHISSWPDTWRGCSPSCTAFNTECEFLVSVTVDAEIGAWMLRVGPPLAFSDGSMVSSPGGTLSGFVAKGRLLDLRGSKLNVCFEDRNFQWMPD